MILGRKFQFQTLEKEYELALRHCRNWEKSKERVLIILQTVPGHALKGKDILAKGISHDTITNSIKYAERLASKYPKARKTQRAYAVVNFNAYRHLHNKSQERRAADEALFLQRQRELIKRLKPTKILISGEIAASHLFPKLKQPLALLHGHVQEFKGVKVATTFDLDAAMTPQGNLSNLLGFWAQHLSYLMHGANPFSLEKLYPRHRLVKTMDDFKALIKALDKAKYIATDTETRDLSVHNNALYTVQFATEAEADLGWILPVKHPKTPWTKDELKVIDRELKRVMLNSKALWITFHGMFDLRMFRQHFGLDFMDMRVWEITAGEHNLNENLRDLQYVSMAQGGLAATLGRYGNDFYKNADFGKEDRDQIHSVDIEDEGFLKYAAMDVVGPLNLYIRQLEQAKLQDFGGRSYLPFYRRHVEHIMGATAHQLSHLAQDGSLVDQQELERLLRPDSDLRAEIQRAADDMRQSKHVQEANRRLLSQSGLSANSLFGNMLGKGKKGKDSPWVFKPSKPAHRALLFFEVMGLEPVSETKKGEPAIDKDFLDHYKEDVLEVRLYDEWSKRNKLQSTYVRGWRKLLRTDPDSKVDSILRAGYSFFGVMSGRLNSSKPNLQQIPSRGSLANIIKRLFIAPKGRLLVRYDYSAHEIRGWANIAFDKVLAGNFKMGQTLRQKWIQNPTAKVKEELATKGDLHILNVKRFFNIWVDKSHELRDAIKAVVFGVLYGMTAKTLGEDIRGKERRSLAQRIDALEAELALLEGGRKPRRK